MASGIAQTFSSLGNTVTDFGKKFKDMTGFDNLSRDQKAVLTLGASEVFDAPDRANAAATEKVQTQNKAQTEAVFQRAEDADAKVKADEAAKVMAAKKNSTAGTMSGRQGTIAGSGAGGSLLGGGTSSIGSKTLLGQ